MNVFKQAAANARAAASAAANRVYSSKPTTYQNPKPISVIPVEVARKRYEQARAMRKAGPSNGIGVGM